MQMKSGGGRGGLYIKGDPKVISNFTESEHGEEGGESQNAIGSKFSNHFIQLGLVCLSTCTSEKKKWSQQQQQKQKQKQELE